MRRTVALLLLGVVAAGGCATDETVPQGVAGGPASAFPTATSTPRPTIPKDRVQPPVVEKGWCSKELVDYMVVKTSTRKFGRGFGRPLVIEGLDVGCAALSPEVSALGYIDTFAFIRRSPGVMRTLRQRIRALGFSGGPMIFENPGGQPEGFLFVLGEPPDTAGKVFLDYDEWIVVQFYMSP